MTFNIEKCINAALKKAALRGESISHDKLAAEAGISKQTLYNVFSRDDAKLSLLQALGRVLRVSIYETFEAKEEDLRRFIESTNQERIMPPHPDYSFKIKGLEEKNALYEDYIESLKKHINSLERELGRLQNSMEDGKKG